VVLFDVTHYHMLSEESQLSRRLTAVGNLAAGVAYEISNPLTVLLGRLEFLGVLDNPEPSLVERHLGIIHDHAARIASTVKKLQVFAHPALGVRESIGISQLLQAAVAASQARMGRVQIAVLVEPEDLSTTGDPGLLEQVFTALFISVAEGAGRRGRLVIRASEEAGDCQILIGGDGGPISKEDWRLVEGAPQGLGFGAALAAAIVREHCGSLTFHHEDRQLAFHLHLPLAEAQHPKQSTDQWRVLFVDDDEELRALGRDMIQSSGHDCAMAASAEEALALMEKEEFDLIVADVRLPGLSGLAFREVVTKRWSHLQDRVVLVTGLSMRPPVGVRLLQKPFTKSQLLKVLEQASEDGS
jgi:CheY-like chemotaxis protein